MSGSEEIRFSSDGALVVALANQPGEATRARHVGPLADQNEIRLGANRQRLETAETGEIGDRGRRSWLHAAHGVGHGADVVGRRPATAADEVQPALTCELAERGRHVVRIQIVAAEFVGQSGVGVATHQDRGDPGQLLDVRFHLIRTESAVDADTQ